MSLEIFQVEGVRSQEPEVSPATGFAGLNSLRPGIAKIAKIAVIAKNLKNRLEFLVYLQDVSILNG